MPSVSTERVDSSPVPTKGILTSFIRSSQRFCTLLWRATLISDHPALSKEDQRSGGTSTTDTGGRWHSSRALQTVCLSLLKWAYVGTQQVQFRKAGVIVRC